MPDGDDSEKEVDVTFNEASGTVASLVTARVTFCYFLLVVQETHVADGAEVAFEEGAAAVCGSLELSLVETVEEMLVGRVDLTTSPCKGRAFLKLDSLMVSNAGSLSPNR